jgi:hypothetical protein
MLSQNLQRLGKWIASILVMCASFIVPALVLLAPGLARAAILPACESVEVSHATIEWAAPTILPDSCSAGGIQLDDDLGDMSVPAMCSENGASMVAPGRVLPVVDARIDAAPGCGAELSGAQAIGPAPDDAPVAAPAFAVVDHAVLGAGTLVPPAVSELAPPFVVVPGAPRAGVKHDIEHPPR